MFISLTYRISWLHYPFQCLASSGAPLKVQCMFVRSTYKKHWVTPHIQVCTRHCSLCQLPQVTKSPQYIRLQCMFYVQNHWVTIYLWKSNRFCILCWLAILTKSLDYTKLLDLPPEVQSMLVTSTQRITRLHLRQVCATLTEGYAGYHYLRKHWVSFHLRVFSVKST